MLLHYLGKLRYGRNANKLHFRCTDFYSCTRVTVYAECIYVFLLKSCPCCWIPCWLSTNTAVTNFRCHRSMAKVNKLKNSDMEKFICNQYGEKLAMLNTESNKIWGWITKLEVIKCSVFSFSSISAECLQKIWIFNFPRYCSNMPNMR